MPKSNTKATVASTDAIDWRRWRHQAVRDLAWCCIAPELMTHLPATDATAYQPPLTPETLHWLDSLEQSPEPLQRHLHRVKSTRLGIYFEALWTYFWQHQPHTQLLAYNRQVQREGKTFGAFDFLLAENSAHRQQFLHVELALKFYLGASAGSGHWCDWVGPNSRDTLENKLQHLCSHQLPLSQHAELATLQVMPGVPLSVFQRRYLLRGYFFAPWQDPALQPHHANTALPRQLWCRRGELEQLLDQVFSGTRCKILLRNQWLSPALADDNLLPAQSLLAALGTETKALQVAMFTAGESQRCQAGVESQRLFVVPDYWPNTATPERST